MTERRRGRLLFGAAIVAAMVMVGTPLAMITQSLRQNASLAVQNERLSHQQRDLERQNERLSDQQVAQIGILNDMAERQIEAAAILDKANIDSCMKTNYALRANREAIAAAEAALISVLRMSPHSQEVADQVAASLPSLPTPEQSESDCNGDGTLDEADYADP